MSQSPQPGGSAPTRSERLDGLPFGTEHRKLLVGSGVGWALDAMDVGLISFVMAALAQQWGLGSGELSLLASIGFVGMAVGASLGGLLADRIGRRQVFALTLLVYGLATGASALAGSVAVLVALVSQGPIVALLMLAGVILVQQIEAHVLQPFLLGRFVSLHPLGVIVAIACGVLVAGIAGALIAVPLVAALNAVAQHLANYTEVGEDPATGTVDSGEGAVGSGDSPAGT
jgi:MFS family permease